MSVLCSQVKYYHQLCIILNNSFASITRVNSWLFSFLFLPELFSASLIRDLFSFSFPR